MCFTAIFATQMALDSRDKLSISRIGSGHDTPEISLYDLISVLSYSRSNRGWSLVEYKLHIHRHYGIVLGDT